jgi:hypothetical protein
MTRPYALQRPLNFKLTYDVTYIGRPEQSERGGVPGGSWGVSSRKKAHTRVAVLAHSVNIRMRARSQELSISLPARASEARAVHAEKFDFLPRAKPAPRQRGTLPLQEGSLTRLRCSPFGLVTVVDLTRNQRELLIGRRTNRGVQSHIRADDSIREKVCDASF